MKTKHLTTRDLCLIGLWAAVISIMAQICIPMPMSVPMTMQTFAITLAAVACGSKIGGIATLIYVLLGMIGLPVFAGFSGGIGCVAGPTGGFIISFPIMAYIIGLGTEINKGNKFIFIIMLTIGTISNYIIGVLMFCIISGSGVLTGITACVLPFIPTAIIKAVLASIVGMQMRKRLVNLAWN